MKTNQLNDHLIQLTRYGFVNAYLVREDDGFTLSRCSRVPHQAPR